MVQGAMGPSHQPLGIRVAPSHPLWMARLLRIAERVGEAGEIPVAEVVLDGAGRAIGWGSNRRHRQGDPLGHAELVALRQAARLHGD